MLSASRADPNQVLWRIERYPPIDRESSRAHRARFPSPSGVGSQTLNSLRASPARAISFEIEPLCRQDGMGQPLMPALLEGLRGAREITARTREGGFVGRALVGAARGPRATRFALIDPGAAPAHGQDPVRRRRTRQGDHEVRRTNSDPAT